MPGPLDAVAISCVSGCLLSCAVRVLFGSASASAHSCMLGCCDVNLPDFSVRSFRLCAGCVQLRHRCSAPKFCLTGADALCLWLKLLGKCAAGAGFCRSAASSWYERSSESFACFGLFHPSSPLRDFPHSGAHGSAYVFAESFAIRQYSASLWRHTLGQLVAIA